MKPMQARVKTLEQRQEVENIMPTEIWLVGVASDGTETDQRDRIYPIQHTDKTEAAK